jgi:hypothetical protein
VPAALSLPLAAALRPPGYSYQPNLEIPMKRIFLVTALALAATVTLSANGKKDADSKRAASKEAVAADVALEDTYVHFSLAEEQVIREYYALQVRSLPPGLEKKVERGEQLPRGWRKKIEPFPFELERRLAPMPRDCRRGIVEGHAVIYRTGSDRVIDVAVLF